MLTAEDGKLKDDLGEFYHKPAANLAEQKKADKLREKLDERREKRKLEQKWVILSLESDSRKQNKKCKDLNKTLLLESFILG